MASLVSSQLEDIAKQIPGYDPWSMRGDCWFDERAAQNAIDFFQHEEDGCLRHIEGGLAGSLFKLEIWQQAIIANLFGWKKTDDKGREVRRYREAFIYVPRKNGKTPLCAGICNYVLFCDNEPGAQIYSAAAEKEQAALLFRHAKGMIEREPELEKRARIFRATGMRSVVLKDDPASVYKVLSADADTKHGGNSHLVIIDELHAQPNRELVDVLQSSMASSNRKHPLLIHITTADWERESICNEKYSQACRVRDNGGDPSKPGYDPEFLPVIFEALPDDDWTSEKVWEKANPNLDVSVSRDFLRRECKKAQEISSYTNTFKRLHLNMRTKNDEAFLDMEKWNSATERDFAEKLKGRACYAGVDLSLTSDITACVLVFPPQQADEPYYLLPYFWVPRDSAEKRSRRDQVPYLRWVELGLMTACEGGEVDYDIVRRDINALGKLYNIKQIGIDPWNSTQICHQLQGDGFNIELIRQGFPSLTSATKELERLVNIRKLEHGHHPILNWMAGNTAIKTDDAGNKKPSKGKSTDKIDGIAATINGIALAIAAVLKVSVYETRGVRFVDY